MEVLRSDLIDQLDEDVSAATASIGSTILIEAPAGGGKSVLVDQWRKRTDAAEFLIAHCDRLDTPIPFGPIMTLARQTDPGLEGALVSGDRVHALHRLVSAIERPPTPTIIVIEDAHLLDQPSSDLLIALAGQVDRLPLILALTHLAEHSELRSPFIDLLRALPAGSTRTVVIPPLNATEIGRMTGGHFDADEILHDTGGLPLLVAESTSGDGVAGDLRQLVLSRFDGLSPDGQAAIALVACAPEGLETTILDATRPQWRTQLQPAETSDLIVLEGAKIRFRHELLRSIVHDDLTAIRRRFVHAEILEHLPEHTPSARRSVHASAAGNVEAVLEHAPRAADEARRLGAHREAVMHLERALEYAYSVDPVTRLEWLGSLARSAWSIGDIEAAHDAVTSAIALGGELDESCGSNLIHAARIAWSTGDGTRAEMLADDAIDDLRRSGDVAGLASALGYRSLLAGVRVSFEAAKPFITAAVDAVDRLQGDPAVTAQVLSDIGTVESMYSGEKSSSLDEAEAIAERGGVSSEQVRSHVNRAFAALVRHDHDTARSSIRRSETLATEFQIRTFEGVITLLEAQLAADEGRWGDAAELLTSADRLGPEAGFSRSTAMLIRARIAVRRGETDAPERSETALAVGLDSGEPERITLAVSLAAEERWLKGDDRPFEAFEPAGSIAERSGNPWWSEEIAFWHHLIERSAAPVDARTPFGKALSDPIAAAREFQSLGMVYEQHLSEVLSDRPATMLSALEALDELGARPLATVTRMRLERLGVDHIPRGPNGKTRQSPADLTARQTDVMWLVTDGLTNAEIATRLDISARTVDHHVAAILKKLDVTSRRHVTERAAELGLVRA